MSEKVQLELLASKLRTILGAANEDLDHFQEKFAENPLHAFEWGERAVEAAAIKDVNTRIINAITAEDSKATLKSIKEFVLERVLHKARFPKRSTSPMANLADQVEAQAWATILEEMAWLSCEFEDEGSG
jgi:hypothetical protein